MNTINLLNEIIANPIKVQRLSTQKMTSFLRGAPKPSFPFGIDMLRVFVEILKKENEKRDKVDRCINVVIPDEIMSADYDTLLNFVKKHCDKANPTSLAQLILSAAKEFILVHRGSEWHEFMMLRQLRETLKFATSLDYEARIIVQEQEVMTHLLQKHHLLEQEEINFSQLLSFATPQEVSLDARKAALLVLSSYHISSASIVGGRFNARAHDKKNFHMLLKISGVKTLDASAGPLSFQTPLAVQPSGILPPETIQVFTENGLTVSKPKNIGVHWENLFFHLMNPENSSSPIVLMTTILKTICDKNRSDNDSLYSLLDWFSAVKEYTETRAAESENIFLAQKIYAELYKFLSTIGRLPEGASQPIVTDISIASQEEEFVPNEAILLSPNITSRNKRRLFKSSVAAESAQKSKAKLDAITEERSNENTPEKTESHGRISGSPELKASKGIRFGNNLETHQGAASLASLRYETTPTRQVKQSQAFEEVDEDEDERTFDADDQAEKSTELVGQGRSAKDYQESSEYDAEGDEAFEEMEDPTLPSQSEFAEEFMQHIEAYFLPKQTPMEKLKTVDDIIDLVLEFAEEAVRKFHGEGASFQAASQSISVLKNSKNQAVSLEKIFMHLYHILYAVVLFTSEKRAAWEDGFDIYYFHANAALIQLNQRILSGESMAHTAFLGTVDRSNELPIQHIMYRFSKKAGVEITGEALKKQPYYWSAYYQNLDDTNFQSERYQKEAWCVLLIIEILRKNSEDLLIEERGLVVEAINAALKEDCSTPVYNAMFFLAATYNGSPGEEEPPIISLDAELIEHRMVQLCTHLFAHIQLKHEDDAYMETLTDQQKIICQNIENFLTLYQLRSGQVDIENFDHETMSVSSKLTGASRQSRVSRLSAYTFRTSGSRNSTYSRGNSFADRVIEAGASAYWAHLFQSQKPLDKKELKFILKGYVATGGVEQLKHGLADAVLRRAFDCLHALPSTKAYASSSWASTFSKSAQVVDVASDNWKGLMPYLVMKGNEVIFVAYCAYHVECQKQEGYVLKTYEIDFMMDNIKILYFYPNCYMQPLWNDTMGLIGKTLDAKLSALKQKKNLTTKDVERYEKMLKKEDGDMIVFMLESASGENPLVIERVNELIEKATPQASASSGSRGLLGMRK